MSVPLVSIIIPCYNAACWLGETLDSAFAQTWSNKEIILVDDGSTDDSLTVARRYEARGLRLLTQPNRGAAAARNSGLAAARGDFIQFLDADDLLAPDKIAAQLARAVREPVGTVFTAHWGRFIADPAQAHFHDANPLFADLSPRNYLMRYSSHDCMMHPGAWLLPRAIVESAGPWDERLSLNDDGEFFARIVTASARVAYCPDAVSLYRSALPSSLSAQRRREHLESAHLALQLIVDEITLLENSDEMRHAAANLAQRFAFDYYPAAPDLVRGAENLARSLGGATVVALGGPTFRALRRVVGWKLARRLQVLLGKF